MGLDLGQKIVVGVAVPVLVFVLAYLASIVILLTAGLGPEDNPAQQGGTPAPASLRPGASASASAGISSKPDYALKIEGARWEGERALVQGAWRGDLSSVHCDLLEGGRAGRAIDWWDRSVAAKMSFPDGTFSQEFVRAGRDVEDRIDPKGEYWVTCWAQFSEGSAAADDAPVGGTPPTG